MTDPELDRLIAATARVSDGEARAWDLAGPEADLLEALMSTTEITDADPDPASPDPSPGDGSGRGTEVVPFAPPGPRRRRWLVLVAAAAVAVVVAAVATAAAFDDPDRTTTDPPASGALQPADPPPSVPVASEDAAAAEPLPRLAGGLQGWVITNVDARGTVGYMTMANGSRTLDVSWASAETYPQAREELEAGGHEGVETTLAGQPALTFDHGPDSPPTGGCSDPGGCESPETSDPPYEPGAHSYSTIAVIGNHTIRLVGSSFPPEEYEALIAGLQQYPADTWVGVLPADTVLPSERPATVDEMLTGLPLPPGFDVELLRSATPFMDRFQTGADVAGAVACGWFESWERARVSGDQATVQAAIDAMGTAQQWPILQEMFETSVNFPGIVWQYAAAMPTDASVVGGADTPVSAAYRDALSCDRRSAE